MTETKTKRAKFESVELLTYYKERLAYWTAKKERLLHKPKIAHAARRIAHYEGKIAGLDS